MGCVLCPGKYLYHNWNTHSHMRAQYLIYQYLSPVGNSSEIPGNKVREVQAKAMDYANIGLHYFDGSIRQGNSMSGKK
jgi:hypothetical protein